jgi:hypothetical protein
MPARMAVHRGCGDGRCSVARRRFEENVGLLADFVKLFGNQEAVVFVGDGNGFTQPGDPVEAAQRVLQQRKVVDQAEKLLRVMRRDSGHRRVPEPPQRITGRMTEAFIDKVSSWCRLAATGLSRRRHYTAAAQSCR